MAKLVDVEAWFPKKLEYLFKSARYKVAYGGRGGTKSWGFSAALLILGLQKPLRILCARETQRSIADSVHKLLGDQINRLRLGDDYIVQKTNILGKNGTEIIFAGIRQNVHNLKSYESVDICWVEEAHTVSRHSWDVLIPTIRKDNSEIWISFNPDLETDETYRRFVLSPPPGAKVVRINWQDNKYLPDALRYEIEHLRATDPVAYEHIYEGVCKSVVDGAVYRSELGQAEKDGRITRVPYDPMHPVHTFWDLGFGDNTSIWFAQSIGFDFRFIDCFSGCQQGLKYYLGILQNKAYIYGKHYLPWDATSSMLAHGRTIQEQLGLVFPGRVEIVPKLTVADGIAAARSIFSRSIFDGERCSDGLQALRHYRYEFDERLGSFKREPLHDWASHYSDAYRYAAVSIVEPQRRKLAESTQQRYVYPGQENQRWMS